MSVQADVANPYWDAVKHWSAPDPIFGGRVTLGSIDDLGRGLGDAPDLHKHPFIGAFEARREMVQRYAWTVTAPDTVAFVREHVGGAVVDPLAGSGYWASLLAAGGVDVLAFDLHPPDRGGNKWHSTGVAHHPVVRADAVDAVREHGAGRTLLLAWPPHAEPVGADVLDAYLGDRVVYLGEVGDACGDDRMVEVLDRRWRVVAQHTPVQWFGLHDEVLVCERALS